MRRWYAVATLRRGVLASRQELPVDQELLADQRLHMDEADDTAQYAGLIASRALERERANNSWWKGGGR